MMPKFKSVVMIALAICVLPLFGGVYVKFDPQGGTFSVPGVTMNSGSTPDEVMTGKGYADPVRIGYNFAGWSSIANPKDDVELDRGFADYYANPVTRATTFYAIWEPAAPYCHDNYGSWWREGDVLCGRLTNDTYSSSTRCAYEVPGRGWISFKWRMVDAANPEVVLPAYGYESSWQEYVRFDDGHYEYKTVPGYRFNCETYGQGDWQDARVGIADGDTSEFFWELCHYEDVDAIVQISDITWESADDFVTLVRLDARGGSLPTNVVERIGKYGELPTPEREGCAFLGWWLESCCVAPQEVLPDMWIPFVSNVTVRAHWDIPLDVAVDPTGSIDGGIEFAGGDWRVYDPWSEVWGGEYLMWSRSMTIGRCGYDKFDFSSDEDIPILSSSVTGCGIYHFQKLYCDRANLVMLVVVDGEVRYEVPRYSSVPVDVEILNGGEHVVEVVLRLWDWFDQNYDSQTGSYYMSVYGSAEIGVMNWWRSSAQIDVNFDARGGIVAGEAVRSYTAGEPYGAFPTATRPGYEFLGWFTEPDGGDTFGPSYVVGKGITYDFRPVSEQELVRVASPTLYARWRTDVNTALDGGGLRFATREDWEGTSDASHDDDFVSAGTPAGIRFGETNVLTTVVKGEGLLSFWWMQGDDFSPNPTGVGAQRTLASLMVWLDGRLVVSCSDYAVWQHMTVPVLGRGVHTVEWRYTPGGSATTPAMAQAAVLSWQTAYNSWKQTGFWTRMAPYELYTREPMRPGAWIDEVAWTPVGESFGIVPWVRGVVEGHAWLLNALPIIEANYTAQIADEPQNYELLILRAFTKLCRLGENENLKAVLSKFGFTPDYQVLGHFFGELDYYDAPLSNEVVDSLTAEAVPAIASALADLELIPGSWDGSIALHPSVYPVSSVTYVDLADVTLCKAALKGALSALAIAESYDLTVDYMSGEMEAILAAAGLGLTFEYVVEDHPDFAKRVRNAERLAEGKELLRGTLMTLQEFDRLMLSRTTSEMHFFEYNEKDADMQQFAREEVAKMLSALNDMVEVNNDDFRYAGDFRIEKFKQPVTLAPFFAGELTRRYLPTEIDGNVPVFDSFPSMAFGGTFPGLTKDIVAGWLAAYDLGVAYTPNSDYEPEVKYRTFSAAIPDLGASATEAEIRDALAGTADEKIRENITDSTSYAAFETWATKVRSSGVSLKEVKASPCSWQSFALAAPELIQDEITTDDLKVEEFKPSSEAGKFDFTVSVKDVTVGSEAMEENLKQMIGLEGADSLGVDFKSENVTIKFGQPENGKLKFTAEPKDKDVKSFFMKMRAK